MGLYISVDCSCKDRLSCEHESGCLAFFGSGYGSFEYFQSTLTTVLENGSRGSRFPEFMRIDYQALRRAGGELTFTPEDAVKIGEDLKQIREELSAIPLPGVVVTFDEDEFIYPIPQDSDGPPTTLPEEIKPKDIKPISQDADGPLTTLPEEIKPEDIKPITYDADGSPIALYEDPLARYAEEPGWSLEVEATGELLFRDPQNGSEYRGTVFIWVGDGYLSDTGSKVEIDQVLGVRWESVPVKGSPDHMRYIDGIIEVCEVSVRTGRNIDVS